MSIENAKKAICNTLDTIAVEGVEFPTITFRVDFWSSTIRVNGETGRKSLGRGECDLTISERIRGKVRF
jgi:hypothetical protein